MGVLLFLHVCCPKANIDEITSGWQCQMKGTFRANAAQSRLLQFMTVM